MLNPLDLTGRTILVTGASSGIGRATAILLSSLGAQVVLVARNEERLNETLASMSGQNHIIRCFDLTQLDDIHSWMKAIVADTGPLHGFVHSAGIHLLRPVRFMKPNEFESIMKMNVGSAMALSSAFRQRGVYSKKSSVVLVSSVMGLVGQPGVSVYAASKGAVISLTKSIALEYARDGIRVNCVAPGQVVTEMAEQLEQNLTANQIGNLQAMHPLGLGNPTDVANAIAFLLSDAAQWITGTALVVDGGYTAH